MVKVRIFKVRTFLDGVTCHHRHHGSSDDDDVNDYDYDSGTHDDHAE